ncbi:hypothetical protein HDU97_005812 [Phlyctochytrium planicorne]|nr:hypothetical protein HDU97_005812 [Phlyctochytrium planicorne]
MPASTHLASAAANNNSSPYHHVMSQEEAASREKIFEISTRKNLIPGSPLPLVSAASAGVGAAVGARGLQGGPRAVGGGIDGAASAVSTTSSSSSITSLHHPSDSSLLDNSNNTGKRFNQHTPPPLVREGEEGGEGEEEEEEIVAEGDTVAASATIDMDVSDQEADGQHTSTQHQEPLNGHGSVDSSEMDGEVKELAVATKEEGRLDLV